ncbi:transglutaminaseTgpA domain-containing protein [Brachybacterium vulturis]|uniref:transglutaminaseTgpA domain-containing protein n=1 Tax=Brachybacterium vulturis TaxID=2017484 RepID=UPI003735F333
MSPLLGRPPLEGAHLTGRALLLLCGLALASAPVSQLLAGSSWLLLTLVAAVPVILGGVVLRTVVPRQLLAPPAQAGLLVVLVLVAETVLGLAPWQDGPVTVLRAQAEIVTRGVNELASGVPPVALGAPGAILLVALIGLTTLLLDLMFLDLGWHTPTALLLMSSLLIPALQQPAGGPWWQVAAPVLAGAMIFATRTVHADPRYLHGDRRPQAGPPAHHGRTLAAVTLCVALVAALTPLLGPALPQLAPARLALNVDLLERWQDPDAPALGPVMIDDDVSVRRSLLQREETEVLRYTTTAEDPSYLRLRTLNTFDGETFRGDATGEESRSGGDSFSDARDDGVPASGSDEDFIETDVEIIDLAGDRLPVPANVRSVQGADRTLNRAMTLQPTEGEVALSFLRSGLPGQRYSIESEPRTSTAEQLRGVDPAEFAQPFETGYTSRDEVPEIASALADELVENRQADTAYDTAVAFQDYFRTSFAYSLTVNSPPGEDPLESFLADRVGYCEQFAAAFALMMTSQGYPARVVIGFTSGEQDGDAWSVSTKNAHAWPEVWFGPEHGWVRFEPTPAAAANGVSTPERTDPSEQVEAPAPAPEDPSPSDQPTAETPTVQGTAEETVEDPATAQATDGGGPSETTVRTVKWGVVLVMALGGLLAAGAAAAVLGIRHRRHRARDARWAALRGRGAGADGSAGADGAGAALAVERRHREAGELAWSEITRELSVRRTAIRWLRLTGAWGPTPTALGLDAALPPHRALEDLLAQIEAADRDIVPEHRAAAARLADAVTAARYAAPLPDVTERVTAAEGAEAGAAGGSVPASTGGAPTGEAPHPLRQDADLLIELLRSVR